MVRGVRIRVLRVPRFGNRPSTPLPEWHRVMAQETFDGVHRFEDRSLMLFHHESRTVCNRVARAIRAAIEDGETFS
jgi:hypothetical protein